MENNSNLTEFEKLDVINKYLEPNLHWSGTSWTDRRWIPCMTPEIMMSIVAVKLLDITGYGYKDGDI